jgi:hypothetical protein
MLATLLLQGLYPSEAHAMTDYLRKFCLVVMLMVFSSGCGLSSVYSENKAIGMTTDQLLRSYAVFSGQGALTFSAPGELQGMPFPRAIKRELEVRGYHCNPTGCYLPR